MNYYVLHIWGDVEPQLHGPYKTAEERDDHARMIRADDDSEGGIYPLDAEIVYKMNSDPHGHQPAIEVGTYSGGFFDDE